MELYSALTDSQAGLAGAVCARAEAHVVRLALLYALLDQADEIGLEHLEAALRPVGVRGRLSPLGVRRQPRRPARRRDLPRAALEEPDGPTRSQVRDLFSRNRRSKDIGQALERLAATGRIHAKRQQQRGRARRAMARTPRHVDRPLTATRRVHDRRIAARASPPSSVVYRVSRYDVAATSPTI